MWQAIFVLLATIVVAGFQIRRGWCEWIIADKRGARAKVAAKKKIYRDSKIGAGLICFIALCGFGALWVDNRNKKAASSKEKEEQEATATKRHAELMSLQQLVAKSVSEAKTTREKEYDLKYPGGYAILSVTETNISEAFKRMEVYQVDLSTAAVLSMTKERIVFRMPGFKSTRTLFASQGAEIDLVRRKGNRSLAVATLVDQTFWKIRAEIIEDHPMGVVMLIGIYPDRDSQGVLEQIRRDQQKRSTEPIRQTGP